MYQLPFAATVIFLVVSLEYSHAIKCFECFDTGPTNKNCTSDKFCTGAACLIFEDGDNVTANAFCLLTTEHISMKKVSSGCWLEPDGKGKHCVCFEDFCNQLRDRTMPDNSSDGPLSSPLADLSMLKHNPFLDYDYPDSEDDGNRMHARPAPPNVLFPSADGGDVQIAGEENDQVDDDDLVPVDFAEYTNNEKEDGSDAERGANSANARGQHFTLAIVSAFIFTFVASRG